MNASVFLKNIKNFSCVFFPLSATIGFGYRASEIFAKEDLIVKRNLMLFLVSALLVCSLTACGCASKDAGSAQNSNGTAETAQPEAKPTVPEDTAPADRPETGTDDTVPVLNFYRAVRTSSTFFSSSRTCRCWGHFFSQ